VNIGVRDFANDLERRGVRVVHVDWRPPRKRDQELDRILRQLM
jgi:hypothetical protein